ncbi:MAG TPA: hypothetical protein VNM69_16360 [Bacillus sp. (in: firmicutes)]|uniref:Uncharacterized protein n=1 Tax=Bacillus oleivorans TaxID=1448271 RepID=A0A285CHR5_9BACI|nr:hypothetical protein [Bacillus oleivorans]SNX67049.1 hypothetical protein SAMN05877753_101363 [Bacillus oleivorans]HWO77439.1 hypothetical protein [Bacillus sp. (in: firmicutes)]
MDDTFDLTDVGYIKRITVGNTDPTNLKDESVIERQMAELNFCLEKDFPRGKIVGQEKNFQILRIGEHQVVLQSITYHIGYKRRPARFENR